MKKRAVTGFNIPLQLSVVLLLLVLLTTSLYARYISSAAGGDGAQVAFCTVENISNTTQYFGADGNEIKDLQGLTMGVHEGNEIKKVVYTTELTVRSEVALNYEMKIEGLPASLADSLKITLDNGSEVIRSGSVYTADCDRLEPKGEAVQVKRIVTFEVVQGGIGQTESVADDAGNELDAFEPKVSFIFTQAGGIA